ncbi:bifunctional methylenetetrahydrofolate dehydrogenase/cyclohydrolase, mitochondrial [Adelges cooleyi]|uniref:bifunctional methylenetetrahydrofolate dehydrogenase/cyclohydrolase, mitochondrial n=1 Tax=Adelges cooleyi TaxID=133065 RepID=UPI002180026D|nr:bifunctional methylenetetrahydrofolate dehydrogenase/cyclohydrolase, mitochondrial [Adelges cooleyi]
MKMPQKCWANVKLFARSFHASSNRLKAKIIDGKSIANTILEELRLETKEWVSKGHRAPCLVAVLVGEDTASKIYVNNKIKAAKVVGIKTETIVFKASTSQTELLGCIERYNHDKNVDGILVQLPLPEHITERTLCNAVAPHKDVDGFNIVNVGRFCLDMQCLGPCTPLGVHELIRRTGIPTFGRNAVVCGRSKNVGMPIAMLLHADNAGETSAMDATTTICHRYTPPDQLAVFTKNADIIVSAAGVPNLIRADMIKPGAAIIDVGITRMIDEQTSKSYLVGDVDFKSVSEIAGYITPVPGGVGPMTVAMLMRNTIAAAKKSVIYNILDPGAVIYKQASQIKP